MKLIIEYTFLAMGTLILGAFLNNVLLNARIMDSYISMGCHHAQLLSSVMHSYL